MSDDRYGQILKSLCLGVVLLSNAFVFVPLTLYVGNATEFPVSFYSILGMYVRPMVAFLLLFTLFGVLLKRSVFRRYLGILAIGLFALQVVLAALTVMGNSDALKAQPFLMGSPDALENIHSYSTKGNVLHVIVDSFQADVFDELVNEENRSSLRDGLDGFVFFLQGTSGCFPADAHDCTRVAQWKNL